MNKFLVVLCLCLPAMGQTAYSGSGASSGSAMYGVPQGILTGENTYCPPGSSGELTEGTPTWGASDGPAALPSQCINTSVSSTPSGTHIGGGGAAAFVPGTSATLANVLASTASSLVNLDGTTSGSPAFYLQCGDTIQVAAGSSYQGSFTFPALACDGGHWIMVKSSGVGNANFPGEGVRATPCLAGISNDATNGYNAPGYPPYSCPSYPAVLTAQLDTTAVNTAAIQFATRTCTTGLDCNSLCQANVCGADHYRFIGIEVTKQADVREGGLAALAADGQTNGANHVIFDRSLIHGQAWTLTSGANSETQGGIKAKNAQWIAIINSWDYDTYCNSSCVDSQDFSAGSGHFQDGPVKLYNNLFASAGMSFEFGGGGQGPGTPNTDQIEIRANQMTKPLGWMIPIGTCWLYPNAVIAKNDGEFKNGTHLLFEGNYMENAWYGCQSDQTGHLLLLNPRNQSLAQNLQVTFDGTDMVVTTPGPNLFTNTFAGGQIGYPDDATNCPVGGCHLKVNDTGRPDNGAIYIFCNGTNGCNQTGTTLHSDGKQARLVTPAGGVAPAGAAATSSCIPGLDPSAMAQNVVVRYNELYNATNGVVIESTISGCGDEAQALDHASIHDNYLHGLSMEMSNDTSPYQSSYVFEVENGQIFSVIHAVTIAHNTAAVEAGQPGAAGALGMQREAQDNRYMQGVNLHDNVSPAAWHISHGTGAMLNGGLGTNFQTDACTPYYPNANSCGTGNQACTDGNGNVINAGSTGITFGTSGNPPGTSLSEFIVTQNGKQPTSVTCTPGVHGGTNDCSGTSFTLNHSVSVGDALTVRDVTACDWTFVGNIMGEGLPGSGNPEEPYPNGTDPYSGLATPNANNWNSCGTGGTQACILDASTFASIFNSWDARTGDLRIASSTYQATATDAGSRTETGKDPGADFFTVTNLLTGVRATAIYNSLSITSGTLTAATHNVVYQNALVTPDYGATGGGASPYKSWWQETDTTHCGGNCQTTPAALVAAGIIIGRDGTVNGPFIVLTVARASGVSTITPRTQMVSEMLTTSTIPWQIGQIVTMTGFVDNGSGAAAHDSTFNGTCTITAVTANNFSCTQSGTGYDNINSHLPYHAQGGTPAGAVSFAPITPGTYQFWMGAKDGAFQKAWAQISVTVN